MLDQTATITLYVLLGSPFPSTMRVQGKINHQEMVILIDTGNTHNFLDISIWMLLKLSLSTEDSFEVKIAKGAMDPRGVSPPSFRNGLGTIYIASFWEGLSDLITRYMSLELRYGFGKVLGTQNRLTLRLTSHHCVLCLNPIKGIINIVILTHTHTSTCLTFNMKSNNPNHTSIMLTNKDLPFI